MAKPTNRLSTALADRYRIERHLGEGGMANVYLAEDLKHNRRVAIKVLRPELAAALGAGRFLKEIAVTAQLQHPNILPLYDSGEADSFLFYVMPFIDGESLRDRLDRERQLGVEETIQIAKSVAAALDYAHRQEVIHRDIKPENVLLYEGQALVADFGIALAVSHAGGSRLTESGLSIGTPLYMSPEQASADEVVDGRTDIYSLGAVVFEMLAGRPPFEAASAQGVMSKIIAQPARRVSADRPAVPANVDHAVHVALSKLPADRFSSPIEFAEALENPAFRGRTTRQTARDQRHPGVWVSWSLVVLASILATWGWLRPAPPRPVIRYRTPAPWGAGNKFYSMLAVSPNGASRVHVGTREGVASRKDLGLQDRVLWIRSRDALQATPIPGAEDAWNPFFSIDGTKVGFLHSSSNSLKVVTLDGRPPTTVAQDVGRSGAAWGPDDRIYVAMNDGVVGLARFRVTGGDPETVSTLDTAAGETGHLWPDALPGGTGVLFTVIDGDWPSAAAIAVVDLKTGIHRKLVPGVGARYATDGYLVYVTADGTLMAASFDEKTLAITGDPVRLADGVRLGFRALNLALSRTGTLIYATAANVSISGDRLVWVTRDGTVEEIDPGWTGTFISPRLSPDGTRLAVGIRQGEEEHVWIKQLDRGPLTRFSLTGTLNYWPTWSPDGRHIAFVSVQGNNRTSYAGGTDGSTAMKLTLGGGSVVNEITYSPDGEWLVYRTGSGSTGRGRDLHAVRVAADGEAIPLVVTEFEESSPSVSPDGRWLAYVSNRSGRSEVYVRPFPNTGTVRWQVSHDGGSEPVWAHSGRELFYKTGGNLVSVAVLPDTTFTMGEQRVLFATETLSGPRYDAHALYDVAPDDQRFVMVQVQDVIDELVVVENFFEELKAKVRNR